MEFWPDARAHMAHHDRALDSYSRVCDCGQHYEYGRALRRLLYFPRRRVLCEFGDYWVGIFDVESDQGEESGMFIVFLIRGLVVSSS